ncbi:hypothetical protein B0O99DRAFT_513547 [Bisporella sp. PMI_857]|nr:hypothetical protein B0O99DRAFT_513547 [Bisporella sp. PMI_857]
MLKGFFSRGAQFNKISQDEDCESLVSSSNNSEELERCSHRIFSLKEVSILVLGTFFVSGLLGAWIESHHFRSPTSSAINQVSKYSPLLPDIDITFSEVQFNGSLLRENVFRQDAGPDVDAAWESLGVDYRAAIVPQELAAKSGLTPDQVQVAVKYGGGYPANVEGLHHLHCLNLLRQSLYYNFDYYHALGQGAFKNDDRILHFHVSHCLDILRQQLMCTVDIGVLGQVWWNKQQPTAYPDFNTKHTCRNFEDVRKWAEKHQAPADVPDDYLQRPRSIDEVSEFIP